MYAVMESVTPPYVRFLDFLFKQVKYQTSDVVLHDFDHGKTSLISHYWENVS